MMTIERTTKALQDKIKAANFGDIDITLKCNGDVITIKPCGYGVITDFNQIDYYLVESDKLPWLGSDRLEDIADKLNRWPELLKEQDQDKLRLAEMNDRLSTALDMTQEDWDNLFECYSDYYKDVYGHRPHNVRCPLQDQRIVIDIGKPVEDDDDEHYTPSATNGDYSPACPWNAPGMSVSDFI